MTQLEPSSEAPAPGPPPLRVAAPPRLTPVQQEVLDQLGSTARPRFRDDLRDHLTAELTDALAPLVAGRRDPLIVTKHKLALVHACETRFLADQSAAFAWSPSAARGVVAHKAVELLVGWPRAPIPLDLVEAAIASLERDEHASSVGSYLVSLSDGERAELVVGANEKVAAFLETFPPLQRRWRPVTEARVRADLCDDLVRLQAKIDLSLGFARNGNEAGKVLIDLKTGAPQPAHVDDLRFYALLDTLRAGVPPRLLVNYYLDAGRPRGEAVTEDLLWSAARRLVDGVRAMQDLDDERRPPTVVTSWSCRWCPALDGCQPGRDHLADASDAP